MSKFEIIGKIAHGGMGEVYKARLFNDYGFEKIVAAKKIIAPKNFDIPGEILREAEILSKLNHLNICAVLDIRELDGVLYLLMEFVQGSSVIELLELSIQKGYRFSEEFLWVLAIEVLKGLDHAHTYNDSESSVIHRDLSPHNLMISEQGQIKIIDFGISKIENEDVTFSDKSTYGKLRYCAPEIFDGKKHSVRSDLYSLGLILFELVNDLKIFDGLNEAQVIGQIQKSEIDFAQIQKRGYSSGLQDFISRLSAFQIGERFESAERALNFVELQNNSTMNNRSDVILKELKNLKESTIERTKTVPTSLKRKKTKLKVRFNGLYSLLLLGIVLITGVGYRILAPKNDIQIRVISEGQEVSLVEKDANNEHTSVGGELGFYLNPSACDFVSQSILSFPALLFDVEIEKKLAMFNMKHTPNSFLSTVIQNFANQKYIFSMLKSNCEHNAFFKSAALIYEDLEKSLPQFSSTNYPNFADLRKEIEPRVLFNESKWSSFFSANTSGLDEGQKKRIANQIESIEVSDIEVVTGLILLQVSQDIFPNGLEECRTVLDNYWVRILFQSTIRDELKQNMAVILAPFPLGAEIASYGKDFIEFKDLNKRENSLFKTKGVCIYRRVKGEVVESSLRHL
ncbi:MAG: protein kinase domain-containing protein [Bdellovibrio sp.]